MRFEFTILETKENGTVLRVSDSELADQVDDFLTEECDAPYTIWFEETFVEFYFGAMKLLRLRDIIEHFENKT